MGIEKRLIEDANLTRGMQLATPERITKVIRDVLKGEVGVRVKVYEQTCMRCGACAKACPNAIISIIPEHKRKPVGLCQNKDKGAQTRKACSAGCIGCMMCTKVCPTGAITVTDFLASIDPEKCTNCGACAEKCPVKVITVA